MVVLSKLLLEGSSSSSSTHVHSSLTNDYRYHVFLSFRGVDTRHSFTDHLHKALMAANITTFLDDEEIETGEDLKPELESAIKASRASIIVMSKNYATSTWCLDELVLILEQRITSDHIVIPIFYHVEPAHVRKQLSSFVDAMSNHKQTMELEANANKRSQLAQKIDRWDKALVEVVNLKGKYVNDRLSFRLETEFIEEIVKEIYHRLPLPLTSVRPLLIGMESSINFVTSWLKDASSHMADILTISGMGGIGKTSLAKHVYGLHCIEFHKSSFIEDISKRCDGKFNALLDLQKQLCDDISKTSPIQVHDVSIYTSKIEIAVTRKKVFLVLDDISSLDQLDALLGSKGFHPGSKIIITTKNTCLTESCTLFKTNIKPKHAKHLLHPLHETESRQLLSFHAFMCNSPKEGYEEVSNKLVEYCQGHPLALEVLGKSLHNRDVAYWEGCIEGLKKEIGSQINNVLRMSFDSLPSKNDKDLFKYIACYFVGIDKDIAKTILEACNISTRSGIRNLIDRCLLSIGWNNELKMHRLLQEMGRFDVRQESPDKPWKRSRLWSHEESFRVLKHKKGSGNLRGLALDMRMLEKEKLLASYELKTDALSKMDNLMLLQLNYVQMDGSYKNFPEEIKWLCMHGFPRKSIPSDLPMQNLVALDMSYSNIESLHICDYGNAQRPQKRQKSVLGLLKILNLSFCKQLRNLGGFDQFPALERLIVGNCIGLVEVSESIEQCVELVLIDLRYCKKFEKLPRTISMLKKVETLLLDGCDLVESQIEIKDMDSPEMIKANNNIAINIETSSFKVMEALPIDMKFFFISLLSSLVTLSLKNNNLSNESFPLDFSRLSMLTHLYLDGNPIDSMPSCVRTLPTLEMLSMMNCKKLKSVEHPPLTLRVLVLLSLVDNESYIEKVVFDPEMSPLQLFLGFRDFEHGSYQIEGIINIQPMVGVEEQVLRSLGWTDLDFFHDMQVGTKSLEPGIKMFYEFGIFSATYEKEEMPSCFNHTYTGPSISFTISSSPNKLRGLNFCSVHTLKSPDERLPFPDGHFPLSPVITISNITKNLTWIYKRYGDRFSAGRKCYTLISHWMFGMNEMEGGDQVTITVTDSYVVIKECGVSLVYDDGKTNEEEEDALGYYKSWNHIIGGDLSPFQSTSGEYILDNWRFFVPHMVLLPHHHHKFHEDDSSYQAHDFRALSPRNPNELGRAREVATYYGEVQSIQ